MIRHLPLAAALVAVAAPAFAQEASHDPWSFSAGVTSDSRSKGISKSDGDAAAWVAAEWESADGLFYAGPGVETIKSSLGSELEVELNVGVRPEVLGFDLDISATHKWQVDANPGTDDAAWEFTGDIKRSIGPASARLRLQYSPDGFGGTEEWTWVEGRIGWAFTDKLKGTAAVGRREQDNSVDYSAWNAGITYDLTNDLEFDLRWYDTDAGIPTEQYDSALVAGISVYF